MDEESVSGRYWCHVCAQAVNPVTELVDFKCPHCNGGFIERFEEDNALPSAETSPANNATATATAEREQPSMWAPILLGMLAGDRGAAQSNPEARSGGVGPTAVIQLVVGGREEGERGREERVILIINRSNRPVTFRANHDDNGNENNNSNYNFGDYFFGPGLEQLLQRLAESDPNRHGTPPTRKSAVEAMPTVSVDAAATCTVCLEEIGIGETAREMPCKHRFHGGCILPWLEMHSSCPVCRFQMPVEEEEEEKDIGGSNSESTSGEEGGGRRFSLPLMWPFRGLFSLSSSMSSLSSSMSSSVDSSESGGNSNSQSQEN